jgi:hypothetical protein
VLTAIDVEGANLRAALLEGAIDAPPLPPA